MPYLLSAWCILLTVGLVWLMLRQHIRGEHDLLSLRNFFLLGFIVFQLTSACFTFFNGGLDAFMITRIKTIGPLYCVWATAFLAVFLWAYKWGGPSKVAARLTPRSGVEPGPAMLWVLMFALTGLAVGLRAAAVLPLIGIIANYVGIAMAAIACGIAGWLWAPRLFNPVVGVLLLSVLAVNALSVIFGEFGRRPLVALGGCMVWGMYYSHWRYIKPSRFIATMAAVSVIPGLAVIQFTAAREAGVKNRSTMEHLQAMANIGNLKEGVILGGALLLNGQLTAEKSMWIMENFPSNFEVRPGFTLFYLAVYPVPRDWWKDKPTPLSAQLPFLAQKRKVNRDQLTLGPGILGHAAADGGFVLVLVYGLFFALLVRYFDELVGANPRAVFTVLPIGAATGQLIGISRGETAAFTALFLISVVGAYMIMVSMGWGIGKLLGGTIQLYESDEEPGEEPELGDYAGTSA